MRKAPAAGKRTAPAKKKAVKVAAPRKTAKSHKLAVKPRKPAAKSHKPVSSANPIGQWQGRKGERQEQ